MDFNENPHGLQFKNEKDIKEILNDSYNPEY